MFAQKAGKSMLSLVTAGALAGLCVPLALHASEHIDAPLLAQDRGSDLADMYAFLDPNDNSKVVLIMATQGSSYRASISAWAFSIPTSAIDSRSKIPATPDRTRM